MPRRSIFLVLFLTVFAGLVRAPASPRALTPDQQATFAKNYLSQRLKLWQGLLHLNTWNVSLDISPRNELRAGTVGNIHWDDDQKYARIRVMQVSDYKVPFYSALEDMEFTVVHELLHLELSALPRTDESRVEEEHAVDHMAEALLRLNSDSVRITP